MKGDNKMSTIKKCDVCKKKISSMNPSQKINLFVIKDIVNGIPVYRDKQCDICSECKSELLSLTKVMQYKFYLDKQFKEVKGTPTIITYNEVEEPTGSPVENEYYELVDDNYILSEDTEVDAEKTYYTKSITEGDNPKEKGWYEKTIYGDYVLSEDTEVNEIKIYYEKIKCNCDC